MARKRIRLRKAGRAFTLVELLVVIAIVALLVSILMPSLAAAKDVAMRARCGSNERQIGIGMLSYDADFLFFPSGKYNIPNGMTYGQFTFKDSYNMRSNVVFCPTNWKFPGTGGEAAFKANRWDNRAASFADPHHNVNMGYLYLAGASTRADNDDPSTGSVLWPKWWGWGGAGLGASGFFPQRSATKDWGFPNYQNLPPPVSPVTWKSQPPSLSFLLFDLSYYSPDGGPTPLPYGEMPLGASHLNRGSANGSAAGGNTLFKDGHVEWFSIQPGKMWFYHGGTLAPTRVYGSGGGVTATAGMWSPAVAKPAAAAWVP